jgi:hypothetical protein
MSHLSLRAASGKVARLHQRLEPLVIVCQEQFGDRGTFLGFVVLENRQNSISGK